jgi:hypothetical protein
MAWPKRRSFSVMVVLPASGWEIMAKVLRVATSSAIKLDIVDTIYRDIGWHMRVYLEWGLLSLINTFSSI